MERTKRLRHRDAAQIQSDMEDLFRTLVNRQRTMHHQVAGGWRPHLEVFETGEALVVRAELAGVDEATLDVAVEDRLLQIRGQRRPAPSEERRVYHQMDISYGPFVAEVFIPFAIEPERVEATYDGGMLQVVLPKVPARRIVPRTVRVDTGAGEAPRRAETLDDEERS
ncbi:MAG: Hsp20/alpha crystallin family protein [Chloroflexota bacterium]|nr:Hsp20/alpha crystallin family protein [Chloroflexota bacterium]